MAEPRYKRVLLKLSGEALEGDGRTIDPDILDAVAREVIAARELGTQVAIVDEFLRRHGLSYGREASPGTYTLVLRDHPSFIPGRAAWVHVGDEELGVFGELHPELLDRWGLYLPVAACELRLDALG